MKQLLIIAFILMLTSSYAQSVKIYDPQEDVRSAISNGIVRAKAEKKHLFLQIGGNWCPWCVKFHNFCSQDKEISTFLEKNYVVIKVNYSKENRNLEILKKLEYPQRFGFPVFVILDKTGKRIHTQSSGYLEEEKGYSKKRVLEFLTQWSPDALNPEHYLTK